MTLYRTGIIDGLPSKQELPSQYKDLFWSDASRWLPDDDSRTQRLYVLECTTIDSDKDVYTWYHICTYDYKEFRDVNERKLINIKQYTQVKWACIK